MDGWLNAGEASLEQPSIAGSRAIGQVETSRGGSGGTAELCVNNAKTRLGQ
ncbi:hypothetical protein IG631_04855 [Alternaria alternata]|nr:hypothetical protein IG631_04855 [Alternaria alternata]